MKIDCSFPGGNIVVERLEEDAAWIHQDLRDTGSDWFYWCFRVNQAEGKAVHFHFTKSTAIGARGPAVSRDGGETWEWLGADAVEGNSFRFTFPAEAREVIFSMTVPYTGKNWETFLSIIGNSRFVEKETLCLTRKGRPVEQLRVGCLQTAPDHRVLVVARHHSCETMASFVLEGLISFILADSKQGDWLRGHVEFLTVPFMDREGVEAGDQGKLRKPHDHNRDYNDVSIYPETTALRKTLADWAPGLLRVAFDLHCPWLKGSNSNETLYLVGERDPAIWKEQQHFAGILERGKTGPLPFFPEDAIPFGTEWNTEAGFAQGTSFTRWMSEQHHAPLASSIEVPYANAHGVEVNPGSARKFGADLGRAIAAYLAQVPAR